MGPLVTGVAVVLLFSVAWPISIRSVNGLLCFGVTMGGFVAGIMQARANGGTLEPSRGLKLGGRVGLTAAAIVILVDLLVEYVDMGQGARAGVDFLDPIPKYIYLAIYGIWDGLLDLVSRGEQADGLEWPGRVGRYIILLASTYLFAGFGGGVASSTVDSPAIDDLPEDRPDTPFVHGWMRQTPAIVQLQQPQEAQIYDPPPSERPVQRPAAATGTYGAAMAPSAAATGTYGAAAPSAATGTYGTAVVPSAAATPMWVPDRGMTPQPYFDEAAQMQGERRPRSPLSWERAPAAGMPEKSATPEPGPDRP